MLKKTIAVVHVLAECEDCGKLLGYKSVSGFCRKHRPKRQ